MPSPVQVCVELARALLHLQDCYDLPSFARLRHTALTSLTVHQPLLVAGYLTTEFYSPTHSTRQRMDILEVCCTSRVTHAWPHPLPVPLLRCCLLQPVSSPPHPPSLLSQHWSPLTHPLPFLHNHKQRHGNKWLMRE